LTKDSVASGLGGTPGSYLRLSAGATSLAMGGAFTSSPEYLAPWWNPSSLSPLRPMTLSAGSGLRSLGRTDAYGSFEFRIPPRVGMGVMFLYRGDPFLKGIHLTDSIVADGSYTPLTGKLVLSYYVNKTLTAGGAINLLYQRMPTSLIDNTLGYSSTRGGIGAIDLGVTWTIDKRLILTAVAQYLGADMLWEIQTPGYNLLIEDRPLPSLTFGSRFETVLLERPLIWRCDARVYALDGDFKMLEKKELQLSNGIEWRYWDAFYLRAGIGEIPFNTDIYRDRETYREEFGMRVALGFSLDCAKLQKGLKLNYGLSTDKVWAGVDQQLDLTYTF